MGVPPNCYYFLSWIFHSKPSSYWYYWGTPMTMEPPSCEHSVGWFGKRFPKRLSYFNPLWFFMGHLSHIPDIHGYPAFLCWHKALWWSFCLNFHVLFVEKSKLFDEISRLSSIFWTIPPKTSMPAPSPERVAFFGGTGFPRCVAVSRTWRPEGLPSDRGTFPGDGLL